MALEGFRISKAIWYYIGGSPCSDCVFAVVPGLSKLRYQALLRVVQPWSGRCKSKLKVQLTATNRN